jgi:type VI protein secretion system component VasK
MSRLGEAMGMSGAPEGAEERMEKKSFFIHNLFARVMFPDKTLARSTSKLIRRRMAWKLALQIVSITGVFVARTVRVALGSTVSVSVSSSADAALSVSVLSTVASVSVVSSLKAASTTISSVLSGLAGSMPAKKSLPPAP